MYTTCKAYCSPVTCCFHSSAMPGYHHTTLHSQRPGLTLSKTHQCQGCPRDEAEGSAESRRREEKGFSAAAAASRVGKGKGSETVFNEVSNESRRG